MFGKQLTNDLVEPFLSSQWKVFSLNLVLHIEKAGKMINKV